MPGPLLAVTVERSVRDGFIAGPLVVLGHGLLEVILVVLIVIGLGERLNNRLASTILGLLGGSLLVAMGGQMLWRAKTVVLSRDVSAGRAHSATSTVAAGMLVSLANPYWTLWWVSLGLAYLNLAMPYGFRGVGIFLTGHLMADLFWYCLVAYLISRGFQSLPNRFFRVTVAGCGIFLVVLGLWFFAKGLTGAGLLWKTALFALW